MLLAPPTVLLNWVTRGASPSQGATPADPLKSVYGSERPPLGAASPAAQFKEYHRISPPSQVCMQKIPCCLQILRTASPVAPFKACQALPARSAHSSERSPHCVRDLLTACQSQRQLLLQAGFCFLKMAFSFQVNRNLQKSGFPNLIVTRCYLGLPHPHFATKTLCG